MTVEVTNPAVDHTACRSLSCQEHVASRLLAKSKFATSQREGPWIEIGWFERSFGPDQRFLFTGVVTKTRPFAAITAPPTKYHLVDGRFYTFRIRTCTGETAPCAYALWRRNGVVRWEPLWGNADMGCSSGTICRFEYFRGLLWTGLGSPSGAQCCRADQVPEIEDPKLIGLRPADSARHTGHHQSGAAVHLLRCGWLYGCHGV
jgi:hypothetical protein